MCVCVCVCAHAEEEIMPSTMGNSRDEHLHPHASTLAGDNYPATLTGAVFSRSKTTTTATRGAASVCQCSSLFLGWWTVRSTNSLIAVFTSSAPPALCCTTDIIWLLICVCVCDCSPWERTFGSSSWTTFCRLFPFTRSTTWKVHPTSATPARRRRAKRHLRSKIWTSCEFSSQLLLVLLLDRSVASALN